VDSTLHAITCGLAETHRDQQLDLNQFRYNYILLIMNIQSMEKAAASVSNTLKLLSNSKRLLILCQVVEQERSVGELAELIGASQVTVSQQLALLRNTGIVHSRRQAQTIYYSIADDRVRSLVEFLYETFCPQPATKKQMTGGRSEPISRRT